MILTKSLETNNRYSTEKCFLKIKLKFFILKLIIISINVYVYK